MRMKNVGVRGGKEGRRVKKGEAKECRAYFCQPESYVLQFSTQEEPKNEEPSNGRGPLPLGKCMFEHVRESAS